MCLEVSKKHTPLGAEVMAAPESKEISTLQRGKITLENKTARKEA
jgi:hypothetical protein